MGRRIVDQDLQAFRWRAVARDQAMMLPRRNERHNLPSRADAVNKREQQKV
jgi:hypothetical protein